MTDKRFNRVVIHQGRFHGFDSAEEYDRHMIELRRDHFNSKGDWVEFDNSNRTNYLETQPEDVFWGLAFLLAHAVDITVGAVILIGGTYGFGLLMGWW